jgi:AcrR family transcriptional regulator
MTDGTSLAESKPHSLRDRQRAERELLILAEAERLLSAEGYDGLVMERLAELVGVSKGTLYQHFAKKEDLVGAIVLRGVARAGEHLACLIADGTKPASERLGAILTTLLQRELPWMSTIAGPQKHELSDALADQPGLRDAFIRFFDGLCALIRQGQESGEFDPAIPAPIAAHFLMSLVSPRGRALRRVNAAVSSDEFAALAARFYFNGLCLHPVT